MTFIPSVVTLIPSLYKSNNSLPNDEAKLLAAGAKAADEAIASCDASQEILETARKSCLISGRHFDNSLTAYTSPNGQLIASASADKTVRLRQRDGSLIKKIPEHKDVVNSVSFSRDSQILASASDDKTVRFWDVNGQPLPQLQPVQHIDRVTSVLFSPTEDIVASAIPDGTVTR